MRGLMLFALLLVGTPQNQERVDRLTPSRFPNLSGVVRAELERRGCNIPQAWSNSTPHNIVTGSFTGPDRVDVAALCSVNGVSKILVFPGGAITGVLELAEAADEGYIQAIGGDRGVGYSRAITTASPARIAIYLKRAPSIAPFPVEYDGIEDVFVEKASTIRYWLDGKWLAIPGAD